MGLKEWRRIFCSNVRYLRKKYYLSQPSLAALLEIGVGSLRRLEREDLSQSVTVHTLQRVCLVFGVSSDAILSEHLDTQHPADHLVQDGAELQQ